MSKPLPGSQVEVVVRAIQDHYFSETPPPKYVTVEAKTVRAARTEPNTFFAKVTIEAEHVTKRVQKHVVNIRFRLDAKKRVVGASITHL